MTVLGIETSTAVCSVGLFRDGVHELEHSLHESHIHSEKLLTLVQQVVDTAGIRLSALDALAVSIGPGSFTGLRIGLSTAKGLAFSLGKYLVAVPTLDAIAESGRQWHRAISSIRVVLDAKRDEWYVGEFRVVDETIEPMSPVSVRRTEDAVGNLEDSSAALVLTDNVPHLRRLIAESIQIEDVHSYCRGGVVAALGARKALAGEYADVRDLEPVYLKDFVVRSAGSVL